MEIEPRPPFSEQLALASASPFPRAGALAAALTTLLLLAFGAAFAAWWFLRTPEPRTSMSVPATAADRTAQADRAAVQAIPIPEVEPVGYLEVSRERARALNAAVPFTKEPVPPAAPFRATLAAQDLERAADCLAAAGYYEAGDDVAGAQAVVQVVLNRARHPAFPATICGVVFQGAERSTGCQFSFTCDGAITRRTPSVAAWQRARGVALAALGGYVFAPVGHATHFHTDWVVPNWSATVEKLVRQGTHLFFRWRGRAGTPAAFGQAHAPGEPQIAALAALSPAHRDDAARIEVPELPLGDESLAGGDADGGDRPETLDAPAVPARLLRGHRLMSADVARGTYQLATGSSGVTPALALVALDLCRLSTQPSCAVAVRGQGGQLDFHYQRDTRRAFEQVMWNCDRLRRADASQCIPPGFRP